MNLIVDHYIPDDVRAKCVKEFSEFFSKKIAVQVEDGLYNYNEQFCKSRPFYLEHAVTTYIDKKRDIIFNLKENGKTIQEIIDMIDNHKFNPYNIAFLRPEELNKEVWERIVSRIKLTEKSLNELASVTWKPCGGCKSTKYYVYQLQTRSIDEPMTTFYICKECNLNYRF